MKKTGLAAAILAVLVLSVAMVFGVSDTDIDGLTDWEETNVYGTDPAVADTDGGGVNDGKEVQQATSPLDPNDEMV